MSPRVTCTAGSSFVRIQKSEQVLPVRILRNGFGDLPQLRSIDPAALEGNFLGASDLQALTRLNRLDEVAA